MVDTTGSMEKPGQDPLFGQLSKNWGWLLALGILNIILGTIGLGMSVALTVASVVVFGVLLLMGGGIQLFNAFKCKGWKSIVGHIMIALLYIVAGIIMVSQPVQAGTTLTALIAGLLIGVGLLRIVMAIQMKGKTGWGWLLLAGLVSLTLGGLIITQWPVSGLWVIGLFVALELIFHGWAYVFVALEARKSA